MEKNRKKGMNNKKSINKYECISRMGINDLEANEKVQFMTALIFLMANLNLIVSSQMITNKIDNNNIVTIKEDLPPLINNPPNIKLTKPIEIRVIPYTKKKYKTTDDIKERRSNFVDTTIF